MSAKKSYKEIIEKDYPEFADTVLGMTVEQLNSRLAQHAKDLDQIDEAKDNDIKRMETQELLKEINAPYNDAKKLFKLKNKYIINLIKEKGGI